MANSTDRNTDIDSALDLLIGDTPAGAAGQGSELSTAREKRTSRPSSRASQTKLPTRPESTKAAIDDRASERPRARTGRPPGVRTGTQRIKDKTSLALDQELMDRYRKQSWKEECQLGELVERALRDYASDRWGWNSKKKQQLAE